MKIFAELLQPDIRQINTVGTMEDYHAHLETLVLASAVPEKIRQQFEVARNLMLYGWFVYEFYTVASHQAFACLEFALREVCQSLAHGKNPCKKHRGLACYLEYVRERGIIPDGKYHEDVEKFLPMMRNDLAHGGDTLFNYALAMPGLELVADLLNTVYTAVAERERQKKS